MKILAALICAITMVLNTHAQDPITTFEMTYFSLSPTKGDYTISAAEPDKSGEFSYYIDMETLDATSKKASLSVKSSELNDFINILKDGRDTYVKWDSTAVANDVVDLNKEIKLDKHKLSAAFLYGSSWNFDFQVKLTATFKHVDKAPLLIFNTGKLLASDNQFITSDGAAFVFTSAEEVDAFIASLDPSQVIEYFEKKNSKKSLFED